MVCIATEECQIHMKLNYGNSIKGFWKQKAAPFLMFKVRDMRELGEFYGILF